MAKFKKCRICSDKFEVLLPKQIVCSPSCALAYNFVQQDKAKAKKEKAFRAETKRLKESIKTKGKWTKEAQTAFNKYIRLRDKGEPCISCDRKWAESPHLTGSIFDSGHYRSVGSMASLRFEESNCHAQCVKCNRQLSGNVAEYRLRLIKKIGEEKLAWIEGPHPIVKLSIDDIKEIKAKYTELAKQLERDQQETLGI